MGLTASRPRLGVFGGSFDPPHRAHVALAQTALAQLQLDALRVLPTGEAWHKARPLSPAVHRLAMTRLAFADLPQVVVDDREIRRTGPSYTIDTVRELQREQPQAQLFLLIGEDQALALPTWHAWQDLVQIAIICVAERQDSTRAGMRFLPPEGLQDRFQRLQMPALAVSATAIRRHVAAHQGIAPLVGEPVARYIEQHHLFQTT